MRGQDSQSLEPDGYRKILLTLVGGCCPSNYYQI